jgi:hypothetical protein
VAGHFYLRQRAVKGKATLTVKNTHSGITGIGNVTIQDEATVELDVSENGIFLSDPLSAASAALTVKDDASVHIISAKNGIYWSAGKIEIAGKAGLTVSGGERAIQNRLSPVLAAASFTVNGTPYDNINQYTYVKITGGEVEELSGAVNADPVYPLRSISLDGRHVRRPYRDGGLHHRSPLHVFYRL